jgi:hypothetical protein
MLKIKSIAIFSLAFLLVAVLFEFLLSFGGILSPIKKIYQDRGELYYPDKTYCSIFSSEGFGLAKTNSTGWFGNDFKDSGVNDISIVALGNSFVVSRQVFYRDNFLSVAETLMNKRLLNKHALFFNFGMEGINIKELLYLKDEVMSNNHPDYVLVLLRDRNFNIANNRYAPYYNYEKGEFKIDTSFKQIPFIKNYNKFRLLAESSVLFLSYRTKNHFSRAGEILFDKFYIGEKKNDKTGSTGEDTEDTDDTLSTVDKIILKELSKDKRVVFMLDLSSNMDRQLRPLLASSHIIDLRKPLLEMKNRGTNPNYWPIPNEIGHWNIPAHKIIGEEITKHMIEIINSKEIIEYSSHVGHRE